MKVYEQLSETDLSPQVISEDLVGLVEEMVLHGKTFEIKSVKEEESPFSVDGGLIGFHFASRRVPYLSNPNSDRGISGIDTLGKRLVYDKDGYPHFTQRDAIVYATPVARFVRGFFLMLLMNL